MIEFSLAVIASGVAVIAGTTPISNDILSIVGAVLATFITVIDARKRDQSRANTISVIIGSSVVGSLAPGAIFYTCWPAVAARFTWHVWAGLGFIGGLVGWTIMLAVIAFIRHRKEAMLQALADRWLGGRMPRHKEPPDVEDHIPMK